jgi:RNA polymerase sigma-70 factor (ECF subfamily)
LTSSEPATEERLLVEAAQRDPARFADLYEANFERVYAYVVRRLRDRSQAEDVTSEVFQQALASLGRFEWRGAPFAAWLFRIAANAIADRAKRAARERGSPAPEPGEDPEPALERDEVLARLYRQVRELPVDQRRVIEMRFGEEKSIQAIAETLRRSEGAVKQLQFRAVQNLRESMGRGNG